VRRVGWIRRCFAGIMLASVDDEKIRIVARANGMPWGPET